MSLDESPQVISPDNTLFFMFPLELLSLGMLQIPILGAQWCGYCNGRLTMQAHREPRTDWSEQIFSDTGPLMDRAARLAVL